MSYLIYNGQMIQSNNKYAVSINQPIVGGVAYFDNASLGTITLTSQPDVTGAKALSAKFYLDSTSSRLTFAFMNALNDFLWVSYDIAPDTGATPMLAVNTRNSPPGVIRPYYDISSYIGTIVEMEIIKTSSAIIKVELNGNVLTKAGDGYFNNGATTLKSIYGSNGASVWDVNVNAAAIWLGYPDGDQNSAWVDTVGSNDGTVSGFVSTRDLF